MLKEGKFTKKKYVSLFICSVLGWLVYMLSTMTDSIIAGLYMNSEAVSAVGLISPITGIAYFFASLVGIGCAMQFSKTQGSFQAEKASRIAGMGLISSIVLGTLLLILLIVGRNAIMEFYGVTGNLRTYADEYFTPIIILCAIDPIYLVVYSLVSYDGDEKLILTVDISSAFLNMALSLILVQRIGAAGLGYGTLLSTIIAFLILIPHFFKKNNSIHFKPFFSWVELVNIVKMSSATALSTLYMGIVDVIFNKLVIVLFSSDYLPAYTVINAVMNFACALACAINSGSIFVTVAYGENNIFALKRAMKLTNKFCVYTSLAMTVVLFLIAPYWPSIYGIENQAVAAASVFAGRIIPIFFIFAGFVYTYDTYYSIVDRPVEGNILILVYMLIGPFVLAAPLGAALGFNAMSFGFAITPILALILTFAYIAIKKQTKLVPYLMAPTDETEAHYDFNLDLESISEVRDAIGDFLKQQGIDDKTITKIEMVFEDSMVFIMNKNDKKVLCECSVLVSDKHIRLITKDNGIIFDLVKEADDSVDLQAYVIARMMADSNEANNSVTTSFNRNVCIWER